MYPLVLKYQAVSNPILDVRVTMVGHVWERQERTSNFKEDDELHSFSHSHSQDYLGNELNVRLCRVGFKRNTWKSLESQAKKKMCTFANDIRGLCVPEENEWNEKQLVLRMIGDSNVVVPTHFYQIFQNFIHINNEFFH